MSQHSKQMIHQSRGMLHKSSTADEFRTVADQLDSINAEIKRIYSAKWKGSEEELDAALATDHWMTPEQSVASGLADSIGESVAIAARVNVDVFSYANVPEDVLLEHGPFIAPGEVKHVDELDALVKGVIAA